MNSFYCGVGTILEALTYSEVKGMKFEKYRTSRVEINTYARKVLLTRKSACCIYHTGSIRCCIFHEDSNRSESEDDLPELNRKKSVDDGIDSACSSGYSSLASSRKSSASSSCFCPSRRTSDAGFYPSRKSSEAELYSLPPSRKTSADSVCSLPRGRLDAVSSSRKISEGDLRCGGGGLLPAKQPISADESSYGSSSDCSSSSDGSPGVLSDTLSVFDEEDTMSNHVEVLSQGTTTTDNNNVINNNKDEKAKDALLIEASEAERERQSLASAEEMRLLKAMDEANRLIETDSKSLNSLSTTQSLGSNGPSGHSRKSSDTSQISVGSGGSGGSSGGGSSGGVPSAPCLQDPEEDLWGLWGRLVNDWENWSKKKSILLKDLVRRGIPSHFRGITWQLLCNAHNSPEKAKYADYLKTTSACEKVIRRDIARTYPEHDFFKEKDGLGQESLFNVMKAYSLHDREVGYCQGSAFIVGLLLMQMPEEEAFAVLVKLMQDYRLREMFKPSMAELGLCMYQLETLIQELLPDLHAHFTSQSFHTSMYASSWFLTLFSTSLPLNLACRVMDCFLTDGIESIFRVAMATLTLSKEELFAMDMEGMLKYFQRDMPIKFEAEAESYFQLAYSLRYNAKKMKKMEKEYMAMKTKEQEELVELRRLRTENRLLRQRIDCLEAESSALADRLIQGQVSRAEEAEHNFAIKRELAALRQHDGEINEHLNIAKDKIKRLTSMIDENCSSRDSSLAELMIKEQELVQKEDMVSCLQEELVQVRLKGAEGEAQARDLRARLHELEDEAKSLRENPPSPSVAHLQEELIAVRLREAEANLAIKDLRRRVQELTMLWTKHLQTQQEKADAAKHDGASSASIPGMKLGGLFRDRSNDAAKLEEDLMTTKLQDTAAVAELKELRLKVMELETGVQVSANQVKRQEEENKRILDELENSHIDVKSVLSQHTDLKRRYADLESQMKEDKIMARIRAAEKSQNLAELTQKISSLEFKNQELVTEGEVCRVTSDGDQVPTLQDHVAELRAEVARLTAINRRLLCQSTQKLADFNLDGLDSDVDDPEDLRLKVDHLCASSSDRFCGTPTADNGDHSSVTNGYLSSVSRRRSCSECSFGSRNSRGSRSSLGSIGKLTPGSLSPYDLDDNKLSPIPKRENIHRKTSHTLEDAFLEQLPVIKSSQSPSENGKM